MITELEQTYGILTFLDCKDACFIKEPFLFYCLVAQIMSFLMEGAVLCIQCLRNGGYSMYEIKRTTTAIKKMTINPSQTCLAITRWNIKPE